ncbi:glycosyltransferase family 2 protein [Micrococcus luteus]|uniref:glycosyltransferase family 2 protein n=1 Tax=Micrococcus luteus TaxID=1270 RepID=UPI0011A647C2|nr:glycosyltransferase family A protein [Micrococcus luteus]
MSELVSYVIPTYNDSPDHLRQAVSSALNQTHPSVEVIVVDDGSAAPVSCALIRSDDRLRVIRQQNAGPAAARNAGLAAAGGHVIVFLDGDDWVDAMHATESVSALHEPGVAVAVPAVAAFGTADWSYRPATGLRGPDIAFENQVPIGSACRRKDAELVGGFDEGLHGGLEDHEFWLRLLLSTSGQTATLPTATLHYRIRPGQRSERQYIPEVTDATREAVLRNLDTAHLPELLG